MPTFNTDQIESALTKLIVLACGGLAVKYGVSDSLLQNLAVDVSSLAIAIGTFVWSHYYNRTTPAK